MDYQDIEIFLSLAISCNISKTAELLYISQSAVSHRLKNMENELGCRLVERNKGKTTLRLTEKGKAFLPIAEKWQKLNLEICNFKTNDEQLHVTVGCVDSYSSYIFPHFYRQLFLNHTNLYLCIKTFQIAEIFYNMANHNIDIGFSSHSMSDNNVLNTVLFSEPMYFLCAADYDTYPECVDVKKLDPNMELYFNWSYDYTSWHQYYFGILQSSRIILDKVSLIKSHLLSSPYWAIVSASVAKNLVSSGGIHWHQLLQTPPERICYRIIRKDSCLLHYDAYKFFNSELDDFVRNKISTQILMT